MSYDVNALKRMIKSNMDNIASFQDLIKMMERWEDSEHKEYKIRSTLNRIASMRYDVRILAALVENDGERMEGVDIDIMAYSASAGADTSWWTKGT